MPTSCAATRAGIKASSADRRFSVDAAVYFIEWDDLQINAVRNGLGVVDNAAAAQSKGAELTLTLAPTPAADAGWRIRLHGRGAQRGCAGPRRRGRRSFARHAEVHRLALRRLRVRSRRARCVRRHDRAARDRSRRRATTRARAVPQYELPEYTTVDLRTGLQLGAARLQLYVKNAFDERGQLSATTAFSALGGPVWVSLVQPRTVGLNFDYSVLNGTVEIQPSARCSRPFVTAGEHLATGSSTTPRREFEREPAMPKTPPST